MPWASLCHMWVLLFCAEFPCGLFWVYFDWLVGSAEVGECEGQQWRRNDVLFFKIIAHVSAVASPLGGLLTLYGPAKIARRDLPACGFGKAKFEGPYTHK